MTYLPKSDSSSSVRPGDADPPSRQFSALEQSFFEAGEAVEADASPGDLEPDRGLARLARSRVSLGLAALVGGFLLLAGLSRHGADRGAVPRIAIAQLAAAPLPAPAPAAPATVNVPPSVAVAAPGAPAIGGPAKATHRQRHGARRGQHAHASRSSARHH
jgi:hypothetical protein